MTTNSYTLVATHKGTTVAQPLDCTDDDDAMFTAIQIIMDSAHSGTDKELWAKGEILLYNNGKVIHEMPAKDQV